MLHSHTVPFDNVTLAGFARIDHSPISEIFLALSEISLECKRWEILGLKLAFPTAYVMYGVTYTTWRPQVTVQFPWTFQVIGTLPEILHRLFKDLSDGTNLYLFGYKEVSILNTPLPKNCPTPPEAPFPGTVPKLLAVIRKT